MHFGTDHFELLINIHLLALKHCVSPAINIGGAKLNMCKVSHPDFFFLHKKKRMLDFPSKNIQSLKTFKALKIILWDIQFKYLHFGYIYSLLTHSSIFSKRLIMELPKMKPLFPFLGKALHLGRESPVGSHRSSLSLPSWSQFEKQIWRWP